MPRNLSLTLFPGNTQILQLDGLYDEVADAFPTGATLSATLTDANDDAVEGLDGLELTYVAGTPSSYSGTINGASFNPAPGAYTLTVSGTNGSSVIELQIPVTVEAREG